MSDRSQTESLPFAVGRDLAALHDPRPTLIVGASSLEGDEACFATIIWATPLSHTPPLVAIALRGKSRTMQLIQQTNAFSINVLPATQEAVDLAEFCGSATGNSIDKGARVAHFPKAVDGIEGAPSIAVPVCDMASSWELCTVESIQEAGDHLLTVARVVEAHTDAPRDDSGRLCPTDVLLCVQHGSYAQVKQL